jgi:outer membrane lipoprotein SlyB
MKTILILPLGIALLLGGCASEKGGDVYTRDQVRQVQHFKVGVVENVHKVRIEGTKSPVGTAAEEGYTREDGIEIIVKLEDGSHISVVQAISDKEDIVAGDKVRFIESDGVARVVKY